jgi:hypothetical protein
MGKLMKRLEFSTARDEFYDFCLWRYDPIASVENKWRSASLLFHSFDVIRMDERIFGLIQAIREGFGVLNTVWGVKQLGTELAWEFYFYDYRQRKRERSITKLKNIVYPFFQCDIPVNENIPYFMFSFDIDDRLISKDRDLDEIHIYIGNTGSTVSSGICYSLTEKRTKLENFYFFFDTKKQLKEIIDKTACSVYFDHACKNIDHILWPELRNCSVIVVANKQNNDSVYFSGINVDQLIFFLKRMRYPAEIVGFVEGNRGKLDHLLYDVGFDYRMDGHNMRILKSGYYGVF